ncbi:hypothetical protein [Actinacidiphila sp. ITFR-21]|uniref:hypothetical protein n=1 Tax=Actinacidiphila sp. ITFR-21 TaxID=3075199 RepID=UPI00288A52FC|nr:hypothetical protein [Streptomyces sp. ITFR-21]WNI20173.1 hypothetical protein RLT57_32050 [Streptomyces sp. ITFR-21]
MSPIESAAVDAAINRARTRQAVHLAPEPSVHTAPDEQTGLARLLRHRLGLANHPAVISGHSDERHMLLPGGIHYPAVALLLSHQGWSLRFLATYNDRRRLVFDVVDTCPYCHEPVPTEEIGRAEDLGDYLLRSRDALGGSPRFRLSPAHAVGCRARGD